MSQYLYRRTVCCINFTSHKLHNLSTILIVIQSTIFLVLFIFFLFNNAFTRISRIIKRKCSIKKHSDGDGEKSEEE